MEVAVPVSLFDMGEEMVLGVAMVLVDGCQQAFSWQTQMDAVLGMRSHRDQSLLQFPCKYEQSSLGA